MFKARLALNGIAASVTSKVLKYLLICDEIRNKDVIISNRDL